jgi:predicted ATPase
VPPTLHMHLLGEFLLVAGDTPMTTVTVPRLQSLLAYLVLHRGAPQDRSHLAFLLWPDSTEAQAHTNLRKALHHLRQALPDADRFIRADARSLQWLPTPPNVAWTLDVQDLEAALARAAQAEQAQDTTALRQALAQVIRLYRGDLLPNCYDEWILPERDRLRQLFLQAAERLIALLEPERDYDAAIKVAQRLLRQEPLHEATYRQLMRFYALRGDRAAALRVYHTCVTVLERELGTEPSAATRQTYEALLQSKTSTETLSGPLAARGTAAPLVGRQAEWQRLQEAWRQASGGRPHMVILTGEAGIGKTRLAEELEAWVSRQGMTTASARCYVAEGQLPYAPITTWLRTEALQTGISTLDPLWLTEVTRLVPDLLAKRPKLPRPAAMTEGWQRQHFFEALARAFLCARQPLLLLLDDLQWCDQETLEWLHYLFRFAPKARLLLIGTVRAEEILPEHPLSAFLSALQRDGLVTEVALKPLDTTETTSLAEHIVGHQLNPTMVASLYHETEGNPLFVVEMARAGTLGQRISGQPDAEHLTALLTHSASTLPPTVQTVLATRLAQLSPLARAVANLAAVIGRAFTFDVLVRASGEGEDAIVRGLDELWQRRIVREQGTGAAVAYDFSHDKLREQAYVALSPAQRRLLHRRVAEAFIALYAADLDAVSEQIAGHYERAGLPEQAIPYYQRAGEAARRVYAHAEAIAVFQRAIAFLETHAAAHAQPPRRWAEAATLYEQLGDVREAIGQHGEARQAYQRAMTHVPTQARVWLARLQRKTAKTWNFPPNPEAVLRACQEAERLLEQEAAQAESGWQQEWLQTQIEQLHPLFMGARTQEMMRVLEKAWPVIEQYGTADQRAVFFYYVAFREAMQNHYIVSEETLSHCRVALAASQESGLRDLEGFVRFGLGVCLLWSGALDRAEEELRTAATVAEQVGDVELCARCLGFLPFVPRLRGQVEAVRCAVAHAWAQKIRWDEVIIAHRAWVAWRDGYLAEAEADGLTALAAWQRQSHVYAFQWIALWPLIGVALAQERFPAIMNYVRMLLAPTQQYPPEPLLTILQACLQAWDAGRQDEARTLLRQAVPVAERMGYL